MIKNKKVAFVCALHQSKVHRPNGFELFNDYLASIYTSCKYPFKIFAFDNQSDVKFEKAFCFTNVCTIKKQVNKLFTEVNFECEDCDDSDLEKALLAKNLLETLEESCNL